jgi:hypothetical protein
MVFNARRQYGVCMLPLLEPQTGGWLLLVGPSRLLNTGLLQAIARLPALERQAQVSPSEPPGEMPAGVRVLDGGNRFNAYTVARIARGRPEVLNRITVSRAFTCHQVLALLESTAAGPAPFVVLDLLRTFYDESVPAGERKRLLRACMAQLERLEQAAGGLVSVHPPAIASPGAVELLRLLQQAAQSTYFVQNPPALPEALRLF